MHSSEWTDNGGVADYRARAKVELCEIARQAKQALANAAIDLDLFFMIPHSGDSLLTFGTTSDPPHDQWNRVEEIVCSVVQEAVGLRRSRTRPVACASTDSWAPRTQELISHEVS